MPQLALETFVNQYIWLIIIFFSFYFFSISVVIPRISILQKSREMVQSPAEQGSTTVETSSSIGQIDSIKLGTESGKGLSSSDSLKLSKLEIVEQSSYSPIAENWKTLNYLNEWLKKERKSSVDSASRVGKKNKKVDNKAGKTTSAARTTSTKSKSASSLKTESGSSKKKAKSAKK